MESKTEHAKKIFENDFLELLTWTSFPLHLFWYTSIVIFLFVTGNKLSDLVFFAGIGYFVVGYFAWTLIEYLMHRFVFHFINESPFVRRFHYIFHGIHHEFPNEEKRTMMPPVPGLLISGLYLGIVYLIFGNNGFFITSGIVAGYLTYSSLHYSIHIFNPPAFLRPLWTHHLIHHFQDPERAFGVSTRLWDRIFGTMPVRKV